MGWALSAPLQQPCEADQPFLFGASLVRMRNCRAAHNWPSYRVCVGERWRATRPYLTDFALQPRRSWTAVFAVGTLVAAFSHMNGTIGFAGETMECCCRPHIVAVVVQFGPVSSC